MNIIFALPDYSSGVIEVETPKIILWETYKPRPRVLFNIVFMYVCILLETEYLTGPHAFGPKKKKMGTKY